MKKTLIALAMLGTMSMNAFAADIDFSKLTEKDKEEIGKIASEYIIKNPVVLVKASQELQKQQQDKQQEELKKSAQTAVDNKEELLNDKNTPFTGAKDAEIAVVEFFDYNCVYCSKSAPELKEVMKNNPNVKFVFKEMPIFSNRFPESKYAAETGMRVLAEKGSEAYVTYHNAIYDTGHFEGNLTKADVDASAKLAGVDTSVKAKKDYSEQIAKNMALSAKIKISGTPAFIFMKTKDTTVDNTLVVMSALNKEQLQEIIEHLKAGKPIR